MGGALFRDDAGVSPVVGVVLMVAITVILVTTTAAFVLGLDNRTNDGPPQADFTYEYSTAGNGQLTFLFEEGDPLDPSDIEIKADRQFRAAPGNDTGTLRGPAATSIPLDSTADGSPWVAAEVGAGSEFTIVGISGNLESAEVTVVWTDSADEDTAIIGEWRGPDA